MPARVNRPATPSPPRLSMTDGRTPFSRVGSHACKGHLEAGAGGAETLG